MGQVSRRRALSGAATVGVSVPLLAACGSDSPDGTAVDDAPSGEPSGSVADPSDAPTSESEPSPTEEEPPGVAVEDVPVGGGVILERDRIVVTQPSEGEFLGFSAACTHQGCLVTSVSDTINCACHGSRFNLDDGSVAGGPAPSPLSSVDVSVKKGRVTPV